MAEAGAEAAGLLPIRRPARATSLTGCAAGDNPLTDEVESEIDIGRRECGFNYRVCRSKHAR